MWSRAIATLQRSERPLRRFDLLEAASQLPAEVRHRDRRSQRPQRLDSRHRTRREPSARFSALEHSAPRSSQRRRRERSDAIQGIGGLRRRPLDRRVASLLATTIPSRRVMLQPGAEARRRQGWLRRHGSAAARNVFGMTIMATAHFRRWRQARQGEDDDAGKTGRQGNAMDDGRTHRLTALSP